MKITIDTKVDSPEEIRKVVELLSQLSSRHAAQKNLFEDNSLISAPSSSGSAPIASGGIFNLFGSSENNSPNPNTDSALKPEEPKQEELPEIRTY